ncbi:MAG: putative RND superfamily exporter protein, partial [Myxococcota bacterium]
MSRLAVLALITAGLWVSGERMQPRYRVVDFFPSDAPERAAFDALKASFGRDDRSALVVWEFADGLDSTGWDALDAFTEKAKQIQGIESTSSPTTAAMVQTTDPPRLVEARELPLAEALSGLSEPPLVDNLLSADQRVAVVALVMNEDALGFDERKRLRDRLEVLA